MIKWLTHKFKLGITDYFIAFLLAASIIPVVVIGAFSYRLASNTLRNQAGTHAAELVSARLDFFEAQLAQIESLAINISSVEDIVTVLAREAPASDTFDRLATQARIGYVLNGYLGVPGIVSIDIFAENGQSYHVGDTLDVTSIRHDVKDDILARAEAHRSLVYWAGIEDNINRQSSHEKVLTAALVLWTVDPVTVARKRLGLLIINYAVEHLHQDLSRLAVGQNGYLVAIDHLGRVIHDPAHDRIGEKAPEELSRLLIGTGGRTEATIDGARVLVSYAQSERTGWYLAGILPVSWLEAQSRAIGQATLLVMALALIVILAVSFLFSRTVVAPIRAVIGGFNRIQARPDNPSRPPLPPQGGGEAAELVRLFNSFIDNLGQLQESRAQLISQQSLLNQRVAELEQMRDQLASARDMAESANRAKSQFLATMSHELRTPMNAILGVLELLLSEDPPLSDAQEDLTTIARDGAKGLLAILNDVLDYASLESGRMALHSTPMSLEDVVRKAVSLFTLDAREKGIDLRTEISTAIPAAVWGDAVRLRQVLINLVGNAVKFTEQGSVTVSITQMGAGSGAVDVAITVTDTGIGMTPLLQRIIFQRFTQGDASSSRRFGGTGLGLAICKQLVELMGGTIAVESEVGRGSRFTITVTLGIGGPAEVPPADAEAAFMVGNRAGASLHILVAEDHKANQVVVRTLLERAGHIVDVVPDGLAAVQAVQAHPYDLVLMDIEMPRMDGAEATRAIRRLRAPCSRIPIIALTADALPEHRERYLSAGMDHFMTKPVVASDLLHIIRLCKDFEASPPPSPCSAGNTVH